MSLQASIKAAAPPEGRVLSSLRFKDTTICPARLPVHHKVYPMKVNFPYSTENHGLPLAEGLGAYNSLGEDIACRVIVNVY
jgi:hypothetical protein